ncbi:MAG TPA: hypothetical protein VM364_14930, partial [Vicinamibacterales bacterium]|nr:hypothetical protein [Vicinamibacterales bacterium]
MRKLLALALTITVGPSAGAVATVVAISPAAVPAFVAALPTLTAADTDAEARYIEEFEQDASGFRNARRLGGRTAFVRPALTDLDSLHRMMARPGVQGEIRKVLQDAGIAGEAGPRGAAADTVVAAMTSWPSSSAAVASCDTLRPEEGIVAECDFQPGSVMRWMTLRPNAPKSREVGILENVRWAGDKPFRAFIFRMAAANRVYT